MKTKSELAAERCAELVNQSCDIGVLKDEFLDFIRFDDDHYPVYMTFRQYVERASDAMQAILDATDVTTLREKIKDAEWLVLPKIKDPLVDIIHNVMGGVAAEYPEEYAEKLHKALNEAGLKITGA